MHSSIINPSSQFNSIIYVTSKKPDGSMKDKSEFYDQNIARFAQKLSINPKEIVFMKQIHSGKVETVSDTNVPVIQEVDGLITNKKHIFLGVMTADCLPIVFLDQKKQVIAAIHAGYKGLLNHIITHTIEKMQQDFGTNPENVWVGIGPSIHVCCYSVLENRAEEFRSLLPAHPKIIKKRNEELFLDLQYVAEVLLLASGIKKEHLSISNECTQDLGDDYFSFRRDNTVDYGEMMTIIGML